MNRGIHPLKRLVWHSKPHEGYADPLYTYGVKGPNYPVPAKPLVVIMLPNAVYITEKWS